MTASLATRRRDAHRASTPAPIECAACGLACDGTITIHRDGLGHGPEVPLCVGCGGAVEPSCEHLWALIKARREAAGEVVSP